MTTFLDRLLGRGEPARKAVYGGPALVAYQNGVPLDAYGVEWQDRAAAYLRAYKVGWFYKAGRRLSSDFANLPWQLSYEDGEGDNADEIAAAAGNVPWQRLDPLEQFLRLAERPNPHYSGRHLHRKQAIRYLFTGRALYYLEGGDGGGLPTALYGISPTRMWPSRNAKGVLIGWVLDKNRPDGGVPFSADEILAVEDPDADTDDPQGRVEAVFAQMALSRQLTQHASDVLATGGRLAGMAWPKERALSEDEFADAQRAWRNVTSDPNAARRLLLFPEPMEYEGGAASPSEIGLPELATLTRDEILTAFNLSPEMLGVPQATGLNSGESRRYVREDYWAGPVHDLGEAFEDAFQAQLLPRYEDAVGRPLDFDIEEPDLDDATALVEKVGALRGLIATGFDAKAAVSAVGLDHIEWNGLPDLLDPEYQKQQAEMAAAAGTGKDGGDGLRVVAGDSNKRDASATQQTVVGKAVTREDIMGREFPGFRGVIAAFLAEQRERVIERLRDLLPPTKAARAKALPDGWWDAAAEDAALLERIRSIYVAVGRDALQVVSDATGRIVPNGRVDTLLAEMLDRAGLRITDINETTRRTIAETLNEGVRRGYSINQLVNGVADEAYGGVQGALTANGINVWDDYRAELIARTETMNAYNQAALLGYREFNVRQVTAIDGDTDADCAARNGGTYTVDEALAITDHPNGTLDWAPLTN